VIVTFLAGAGSYLFPLLDKCVLVDPSNAIKTPDQDESLGYFAAQMFANNTYAGNDVLRRGVRMDVKYPYGQTVRFVVTGVSTNPSSGTKSVSGVKRLFDGIPDPQKTPCK